MADTPSEGGKAKRVRRVAGKRPTRQGDAEQGAAAPQITVRAPGEQASGQGSGWSRQLTFSVRERDIVIFLRQLIMLLEAGTPLLRSLKTLSERTENASVRALVSDIAGYVEMGNPLWQAFERHPVYFNRVFVALVRASEQSGTLVTVLERIAQYRERRQRFARRVQSALVYPFIVFFFCIGVVFLIGRFVLPEFAGIFEKLDQETPPVTQAFLDTFEFLTASWLIPTVLVVLVALYVVYRLLIRNPLWRLRADRLKLMIPYIGPSIIRKNAIVQMARSLSLLLSSGLSMMVTLDLTRNAISNRAVGQIMQDLRDAVEQGESIEDTLRQHSRVIPGVVTDMLVTGEESGQMDKIAGHIAEAYEDEVNTSIGTLTELIPPVLAVIMGAFVLVLVLAVFWPLISMIDQLQGVG